MNEPRYRCPSCGKGDGLWEEVEVPGWRSIDENLNPVRSSGVDREVEWQNAQATWGLGCSCGWEGNREQLEELPPLGVDGRPLEPVHPDQQNLEGTCD